MFFSNCTWYFFLFLHYFQSPFINVVKQRQLKYVSRWNCPNIFVTLVSRVLCLKLHLISLLFLHYFYPLQLTSLTNVNWNMWVNKIFLTSLLNTQQQVNNWPSGWIFLKTITIFLLIFDSYFIIANTWRRCNSWLRHYIKHLVIKNKYFKERS